MCRSYRVLRRDPRAAVSEGRGRELGRAKEARCCVPVSPRGLEDGGAWCFCRALVHAVLVAAPFCVVIVLVMVLPLDACSVHGDRGHEAFGLVTTATEAGLETIFEFLAHKI